MIVFLSQVIIPVVLIMGRFYRVQKGLIVETISANDHSSFFTRSIVIQSFFYVLFIVFIQFIVAKEEQNKLHQIHKSLEHNLNSKYIANNYIKITFFDDYGKTSALINDTQKK